MKIDGASLNKVVNLYCNNKKNNDKGTVKSSSDSIQISSLGKSLSTLGVDGSCENSPEKIESLRNQISQGTYKADSNLTAKKMIDIIKGRGV
ncbi:flagellar biosynthesis anti-sigma factor FlgM [Candidatus Clostridium stratigraminis]|uniref:Flagellar biosynthesis anti-sigma factor FlgM n=1 Tax=Candidatus Clostridium stratigraminis TaxID=3381661 RepID=A0ABW8T3X4_9CLOT